MLEKVTYTTMTEGYTLESPLRIGKLPKQRETFQKILSSENMSPLHTNEENTEKMVSTFYNQPSSGNEYLRTRSLKKGCPKMLRLIDKYLYRN
jgi:hypothetical protein